MRVRFICLLATIVFLGPFLLGSSPALAQVSANSWQVTADLQTDGQMMVHQRLNFPTGTSFSWQLFTNVRSLKVIADNQELSRRDYQLKTNADGLLVSSKTSQAKTWELDYLTTTTLIRTDQQDRIFFKLASGSGQFIGPVTVTFHLPAGSSTPGLFGNAYAIQGAANAHTTIVSATELQFSVDNLGPQAIFTINANWPKSLLKLSWAQELRLALLNLQIVPWLGLGLLLPLLTIIVLARLWWRQRQTQQRVDVLRETPPSNLAPILVGVLVNKKIYTNEIVALLIDLCQRGYLMIVKKHRHFFLSQRKVLDEQLQDWERRILTEMFPTTNIKVSQENLRALSQEYLYSPNIRQAFSEIYSVITTNHYFLENPHLTRAKYKLVALGFYFISGLGLIWTAVSGASPFLLVPLISTLLITYLIIKLSPQLIHYTPEGLEARREWLAFGNFLGYNQPLPLEDSLNETFDRYLPYAISLGKTIAWAHRFDVGRTVLTRPDWLVNFEETENSAIEYAKQINEFIHELSALITGMRGPTVA